MWMANMNFRVFSHLGCLKVFVSEPVFSLGTIRLDIHKQDYQDLICGRTIGPRPEGGGVSQIANELWSSPVVLRKQSDQIDQPF